MFASRSTFLKNTLWALVAGASLAGCYEHEVSPKLLPFDPDSVTAPAASQFSQEETLKSRESTIAAHYATGVAGSFTGEGSVRINYRLFHHASPKGGIVILPGRTEPMQKYAELVQDLSNQGYSVYLMSHRGQGESGRMTSDPEMGYVKDFREYTADFKTFLEKAVFPIGISKLFLLAHSMGGTVSAFYLEEYSSTFAAVVLSAPMLEVDTGGFTEDLAFSYAGGSCNRGGLTNYASGQTKFNADLKFTDEDNDVTHSEPRFDAKKKMFADSPELRLGGVSNGWLCQALIATSQIQKRGHSNHAPTLLFQAGDDRIVKPGGQNSYCGNAPSCRKLVVPGAYHEILMEKDEIRSQAAARVVRFFDHYAVGEAP